MPQVFQLWHSNKEGLVPYYQPTQVYLSLPHEPNVRIPKFELTEKKTIKRIIMRFFIYLLLGILLVSCSDNIEVTKEYIYNENWNSDPKKGSNELKVEKLKVINDSVYYYLDKYRKSQIMYDYFAVDSSFCYQNHFGVQNIKKLYFEEEISPNWIDCTQSTKGIIHIAKIGSLENNTWYKFSNLKMNVAFYLYVHVDSLGKVNTYAVNLANY